MSNTIISYTPKGPVFYNKKGPYITTRLMWRELFASRELIWTLFIRDFSSRYRQSVLGMLWAVIMPMITVGMFVAMNRAGILTIADVGMPYPLYAIIGLTIWNLLSVGLTACTSSIVGVGSMVTKINFPKSALVFAASGQGLVEFLIRAVLIILTFIYFGVTPHWGGLLIGFLCLIPIYLIMVGIGFVLSLVTIMLRDTLKVLNLGLMGFMLLTPILYPIKGDNLLASCNVWNPFNYLVNVPRDFIVRGHTEFLPEFLWITGLSVIVFYTGWKLFYLGQTKIAERI
jgi:lipopolysaccharide transport system permease protein